MPKTYSMGEGLELKTTHESYMLKAAKHSMSMIEEIRMKIEALEFALRSTSEYGYGREHDKEILDAKNTIHSNLYKQMTQHYQNLFMWGAVSLDPEVQKLARHEAYKRFLSDDTSVTRTWWGSEYRYYDGGAQEGLEQELFNAAVKQDLLKSRQTVNRVRDELYEREEDHKAEKSELLTRIAQLENTLSSMRTLESGYQL